MGLRLNPARLPSPSAEALAALLEKQAAAQLGERCGGTGIGQIGTELKPTHHVVTMDGEGEALPTPKVFFRIRDALQRQLLVRYQVQRHTQSRGDDLSFAGNNHKAIPQLRMAAHQKITQSEEQLSQQALIICLALI